jgi:hypothetical protein
MKNINYMRIQKRRNKTAYIIPLSGGLDSTYMMYKMITEGKCVVPFHFYCNHKEEMKHEGQLIAVKRIYNWFKLNGYYNGIMRYAYMEYNQFGFGYDTDQLLMIAQKLCYDIGEGSQYHKIILSHGVVPDDTVYTSIKRRIKNNINNNIWNALIDSMDVKSPHIMRKISRKIYVPLLEEHIWKKDIVCLIPPELLDMVWVCRNGINDGKDQCGICGSCKKHNKAKQIMGV